MRPSSATLGRKGSALTRNRRAASRGTGSPAAREDGSDEEVPMRMTGLRNVVRRKVLALA